MVDCFVSLTTEAILRNLRSTKLELEGVMFTLIGKGFTPQC